MAGIQHDTLSDIQEIRRLLDGYSEGFTFIKELIQNADDAEATEIRLIWHPGMNGTASHALLKGPALVVLNDGPFEAKHRDGLMRMGLGSKASDEDRIGRFGLGMKAVFHVCEGFFFLEHTGDTELMEFFSPWHPEHHAEWELEKESDDWNLLRTAIEDLKNPSWDRWFAVWIPLRTRIQCGEIDPIRNGADAYPGDEREGCPEALKKPLSEVSPRLGETLVFLQNVKKVTFVAPNSETIIRHDVAESHLSYGARYYRQDAPPCPTIASEWQKKPAWPKVFRLGDRLSSEQVPDKARWEASVAVSVNRDDLASGTLRIFWNVFLPVGDKPYEEIPLPDFDGDLHIFLHGYFFLNDSRTHVYGVENGFKDAEENHQTGIRIAWNKALATSEDGMLPLVIPALEDCFRAEDLAENKIQQIIVTLSSTNWFAAHRHDVAKKKRFGRFLQNGKWSWCSLPLTTRVLLFPLCGNTEDSAERILVRLLSEAADIAFALEGSATLSAHNPEVNWTAADLDRLCVLLTRENFTFDSSDRHYLRSFLDDPRIPTNSSSSWMALPVYEVRGIGKTDRTTVTANEINTLLSKGRLFRSGLVDFELSINKACPNVDAGFIRRNPPGTNVPELDHSSAAGLIANEETLGIASDRLALVKLLTNSGLLNTTATAIRYLLHGCWVHADDSTSALLFKGGDWETHVRPLLDALGRSWCWVDPLFKGELSEHQMQQLAIHPCDSGDFRNLCNEPTIAGLLSSLQLHESHDFLLKNLAAGEADDELLRMLPIHSLGENLHTAIVDGVWLAPEENPITRNQGSWKQLCSHANIVGRSEDVFLALRQKQVFSTQVLDRDGIMRLAAEQPVPTNYAHLILECLAQRTPSREAANALKISKWLPLRKGGACKLDQIIWIKEAEEEMDRVTSQLPAELSFVTRSDLAIDWDTDDGWRKQAWGTMANPANPLIPSKIRLLDVLREAVASTPSLHLGIERSSIQEIGVWLEAVDGIEADFSSSAHLIRRLFTLGTSEPPQIPEWIVALGMLFFRPWTGEEVKRYDTALEALRQRHEAAGGPTKLQIELVFDCYLAESYRTGRWHEEYILDSSFTLLNQDGDWTTIGKIAAPLAGIASSALLNNGSAKALGLSGLDQPIQVAQNEPGEASSDKGLMKLLKEYHGQLDESVSSRLWGVFLTMLGPNVRDLADKFTDQRTDTIRDELVGPEKSSPRIRLVQCNYVCEIVSGETASVLSIAGSQFNAPRETKNSSLLVPHADANMQGNRHFVFLISDTIPYRVSFKLLDPKALCKLTQQELRLCIERTIHILQTEVLGVDESRKAEVHVAINKIQKLDQKSLGMAQQEILVSCRMHLTQLAFSVESSRPLAQAIKCLDEGDRCEAEARENREVGLGDWQQIESRARAMKDTGIRDLRTVLGSNKSLQNGIATAMRERIKQDGYRPESIPFELFQNADDALAESPACADAPMVFIADFRDNEARFAHWGRPINHPRVGDEDAIRTSARDLVKMLILHGSDKQIGSENIPSTGKFGLGFKSVYLVTDRPELLSKDLAFEVLGATFPKRLAEESQRELTAWLESVQPGKKNGTAIRLPFENPVLPDFDNSFRRLSPFLPIFARKAREVRIQGNHLISHSWKPEVVHECVAWSLERGFINFESQKLQLLHLKLGEISWLLALDQQGIGKIKDIPCLWITAPTLEANDLGFAINGPFEPHPGRTQLNPSGEKINLRLFRQASEALEIFLKWCLELGDQLGETIAGNSGMNQDSFWKSVWELFGRTTGADADQTARALILNAIWSEGCGYRRIIESNPVIPNGLPGNLHTLTSAEVIRFETKGFMDSKAGSDLLAAAFRWSELINAPQELRITSQEIASSKIALTLRTRLQWVEPRPTLSLPFLLRRLVGIESRVTTALCGNLGAHLSIALLFPENQRNGVYDWPGEEKAAFLGCLRELKFRSISGCWTTPENLLVAAATGIEGTRAGFAPPERILHTDYGSEANAHDFFRLCRREMKVEAHELSLWLRESAKGMDSKRRLNALLFLASDDQYVAEAAGGLPEDYKEALFQSPEFGMLSPENQNRVNNAFQGARLRQAQKEGRLFEPQAIQFGLDDELEDDYSVEQSFVSVEDLIREWNLDEALNLFTISGPLRKLVTPGAINDFQSSEALKEAGTIEGKASWYRLLCLGCTLAIPRGRRPASEVVQIWNGNLGREFWEHTIPSRLSDLSKDSFRSRLDTFFKNVVDRYYTSENASGEDAEFWRRVFYDFRKMHHFVFHNYLPETVLEFANFHEADGAGLIRFLRSGHIPGDMQDPNTTRFRGVIGQSMKAPLLFMMRELRRLDVINQQFDEACYYMNSPARRVALQINWITYDDRTGGNFSELVDLSSRIHEKMKSVTQFTGHYDLPLQLYAHKHPR